jgi:hypothetical protein
MSKSRAWLSVDLGTLAEILGLPKGTGIQRADLNNYDWSLRLGIVGDALPDVPVGWAIPNVKLVIRVERTEATERLFGSYDHDPKKEWLILERLIPAAPVGPSFAGTLCGKPSEAA